MINCNFPKLYLPASFVLTDLLCKVANLSMFYLPKCFWTAICQRFMLYDTCVSSVSLPTIRFTNINSTALKISDDNDHYDRFLKIKNCLLCHSDFYASVHLFHLQIACGKVKVCKGSMIGHHRFCLYKSYIQNEHDNHYAHHLNCDQVLSSNCGVCTVIVCSWAIIYYYSWHHYDFQV